MKTPLYLINGPLGAGKTTLLRSLLTDDSFTSARVIENEFASTSIDTDQLHEHQAEVRTIAGICICCSTGHELVDTLHDLASSSDPVIIEATGVANSLMLIEKIAAAHLFTQYELKHGIFVLDGAEATVRPSIIDDHLQEIAAADTLLISKTDLIEPEDVMSLIDRLSTIRSNSIETVFNGDIDSSLLDSPSNMIDFYLNADSIYREQEREPSYTILPTRGYEIDPEMLSTIWPSLVATYGLERMKGGVLFDNTAWHIEATPSQIRTSPSDDSENLSLVCIGGRAHELTQDAFEQECRL